MFPISETHVVWRLQAAAPLSEEDRRTLASVITGFGGASAESHGDFRSYRVAEICARSLKGSGITSAIRLAAVPLEGH